MANIQGLNPKSNQGKVPFLKDVAVEVDPMFIVLTETYLSGDVRDAEIHIQNYIPFRVDREGRGHGSVIIYLRNDLSAGVKQVLSVSYGQVELHITSINLLPISCYRPPQCSHIISTTVHTIDRQTDDLSLPIADVILLGDFNFPNNEWPANTIHNGTLEEQAQARALLQLSDKAFITQYVTCSTRLNNALDLLFTNNPDSISNYRVGKTILRQQPHNHQHDLPQARQHKDEEEQRPRALPICTLQLLQQQD